MDLLKKFKHVGLLAGVAAIVFSATGALAEGDEDTAVMTLSVTEPTVAAAAADTPLGSWAVINNNNGTLARIVIGQDDVVDVTGAGVYPNARFIALNSAAARAIDVALTGGAFNQTLSFQIAEDNAGAAGDPTIDLVLTPPHMTDTTGIFVVDQWNCGVAAGGAAYGGGGGGGDVLETFTPDGSHATNGLGTLTLGTVDPGPASVNNGGANIVCGFRVSTDDSGNPYRTGDYVGTAIVVVDYI